MGHLAQFSSSSNGDTWFVGVDDVTQEPFVLHRANKPSGGHETKSGVAEFLNMRPAGPEREALLSILGLGDDEGNSLQRTYSTSSQ